MAGLGRGMEWFYLYPVTVHLWRFRDLNFESLVRSFWEELANDSGCRGRLAGLPGRQNGTIRSSSVC